MSAFASLDSFSLLGCSRCNRVHAVSRKRLAEPVSADSALMDRLVHLVAEGITVTDAVRRVGITFHRFYNWRRQKPAFDLAIRKAIDRGHPRRPVSKAKKATPLFDGIPKTHEEVMERARILRAMRCDST